MKYLQGNHNCYDNVIEVSKKMSILDITNENICLQKMHWIVMF